MDGRKDGKRKIAALKAGGALFCVLVIAMWLSIFWYESGRGGPGISFFAFTLVPLVIIIGLMAFIVRRRAREIRAGIPSQDEMSKRVSYKSGYYTALFTVWFVLALMWYHMFIEALALPTITARYMATIILFFMLITFSILRLYFGRKGNV